MIQGGAKLLCGKSYGVGWKKLTARIWKQLRFVVEQPTPSPNGRKISVLILYGNFEIIPSANAFSKSFLTRMHSELIFSLVKNQSFSCAEFLVRAKKLFVEEMNKNKNDIGFIKEPNFKPKYTHFALIVIFKFGQHTKLTSIYPLSIWPWVEAEDIGTTQEGDPGMVQRVHW